MNFKYPDAGAWCRATGHRFDVSLHSNIRVEHVIRGLNLLMFNGG